MSTLTTTPGHPLTASSPVARRSLSRILALETRCELMKLLRMPAFVLPTLLFPAFFYLFFGVSMRLDAGPVSMGTYLLATYGSFGVIGAALSSLGIGLAMERGQGWMLAKRATPMPIAAHFAARIAVSLIFSLAIILLLFTLGATLGGVQLPTATWFSLAAVLLAGAVPFTALGLALGYLLGPNSAPAIVNLIYLPMAFCSGLWIPYPALPAFFQKLAHFLPAYYHSQLALDVIGASRGTDNAFALLFLLGFTALCLALAGFGFRRDSGRTFG